MLKASSRVVMTAAVRIALRVLVIVLVSVAQL